MWVDDYANIRDMDKLLCSSLPKQYRRKRWLLPKPRETQDEKQGLDTAQDGSEESRGGSQSGALVSSSESLLLASVYKGPRVHRVQAEESNWGPTRRQDVHQ